MADLVHFESGLHDLLEGTINPRPFVCDGNPLQAEVFIVGFNAATEMKASFWDFWSSDTGFDKSRWLDAYIAERAAKPLRPGKKFRQRVSSTRQRIEWIVSEIDAICLETNLYMTATPAAKDLSANQMNNEVFSFLLETIKPRIILCHGADARKHLAALVGSDLIMDEFNPASLNGAAVFICPVSHLSRGWSELSSKTLGMRINIQLVA